MDLTTRRYRPYIRPIRLYSEEEAALYGARLICAKEGHVIKTEHGRLTGGIQMQYDRGPGQGPISSDKISCGRCDAKIEVTYPEIGTIQSPKEI